ncbi:MAG: hypothetical protein ACYC5O_03655 [Anaerolineae bacterium]
MLAFVPPRKVTAVATTTTQSTRRWRAQLLLLLALVAAFRLGSLLLLRPGGFFADFSDFYYYRDYAALADRGLYPYVNIWSPYPPLFPWLLVAIHRLTLLLPPWEQPQFFFNLGLGGVLALAECGNTALVYALAGGAGSHRRALRSATFYALMFVPAYTAQAHFDSLPVFFLLLGLWLLLRQRWGRAGLATGAGVLTKLLPGLLLPVALRLAWPSPPTPLPLHGRGEKEARPPVLLPSPAAAGEGPGVRGVRAALPYLAGLALVVAVVVAPFLYANPRLLLAPLDIERIRPPWQTIWAVLDGYYGFGLAPADVRDLAALDRPAWSGSVPYPLLTAAFGALWLWLYLQPRDWRRRRTPILFVALSLALLFFFSKGWSPQYLAWLVPFIAVLWPTWRGAGFALSLACLNYLESHVYFMLLPQEHWLLVLTTAMRALVLALLALVLAREYLGWRPLSRPWRVRLGWAAAGTLAVCLPLLSWRLLADYSADRYAEEPARAAIEHVAAAADAGAGVFFARQSDLERFYPRLHGALRLRTLDDRAADGDLARHLTAQLAASSPGEVWLVEPEGDPLELATAARQTLASIAYAAGEQAIAGYRLSRWLPYWSLTPPAGTAVFAGRVELLGWRLAPTVTAGQSLTLTLVWRLRQPLAQPLSAFVHVSAGDGPPAAQADGPPAWPWPMGEMVVDRRSVDTAAMGAGTYRVLVGLYDPTDGGRLPLADGADSLVLGEVMVAPR